MTQKTALLFAGQGTQYVGMGRDFAAQCPSSKIWFDRSRFQRNNGKKPLLRSLRFFRRE